MRLGSLFLALLVALSCPPARAETGRRLIPPVDAPVAAGFQAPASDYAAGHRGIDYALEVGAPVRAAGDGIVAFAGRVAGLRAVTIDHGSGIESTYTGLSQVDVRDGERVEEGRFLGLSGSIHGTPGLHFGVKVRSDYVDPATLLVSLDTAAAFHLAPLTWTPEHLGLLGESLPESSSAGTSLRECRPATSLVDPKRPPNDNIAVAVAGITSKTRGGVSADIYEHGPEQLGYARDSIYHFSYAGPGGPRAHEPYRRQDTYIDIRTAAARLRSLLEEIAIRHPGADVDLIAHSQGGIVARTYLTLVAEGTSRLPRVEHLVTFATPHRGAPGASQVQPMRDGTLTGRYLLDAMERLSARGLPVPDPSSASVRQLAPGSSLMRSLAREDVTFGTRVLALAIPNDPVVPADHALMPGEQGRVVPWTGRGLGGHSAIVASPDAHGIAYSFLAGGAPTCTTRWDELGPSIGRVWSSLESSMAGTYSLIEKVVGSGAAAAGPAAPVGAFVYDEAVER